MGTDDFFSKRKGARKKRGENIREITPYRYLIVCEGEKTEPNYFYGIKKKIEIRYKDKVEIKNKINLDIEGTGRNTEDLVEYAIEMRSLSEIPYGHTWVIFDKDDFTAEQFNSAIFNANRNNINVGWSNNAIELWFLLHFEYLNSAIHRYQYNGKLDRYFKEKNINNAKYEKNLINIFEILCQYGDIQQAIERSKKLQAYFKEQHINIPALMDPCTTINELVEELLPYME